MKGLVLLHRIYSEIQNNICVLHACVIKNIGNCEGTEQLQAIAYIRKIKYE